MQWASCSGEDSRKARTNRTVAPPNLICVVECYVKAPFTFYIANRLTDLSFYTVQVN